MISICRRCIPLILWVAVGVLSLPAWSEERAKENKPKSKDPLQELLKSFPEADTNKDGLLSIKEYVGFQGASSFGLPGDLLDPSKPTLTDVKYGPAARNVLDFYLAESESPAPLVVYIHGGGFVAGDKAVPPAIVKVFLDAGISLASINYRFVDGKNVIFPAPQHDGARAIQFLRAKARENKWNIDPKRIACYGGSAGAGMSMWIGFHDELSDPQNEDPVLRESTRIVAVGTFGGQGTYDPSEIKKLIGGRAWEHPSLFKVYGISTTEQALNPTPQLQALYDECSAITHLTKDDPPLYMVYNEEDGRYRQMLAPARESITPTSGVN